MSDPMKMPEIEDVVSSIRRLVSEDLRPRRETLESEGEVGKFVLTPALRVTEEEAEAELQQAEADRDAQADEAAEAPAPQEDTPAETDADMSVDSHADAAPYLLAEADEAEDNSDDLAQAPEDEDLAVEDDTAEDDAPEVMAAEPQDAPTEDTGDWEDVEIAEVVDAEPVASADPAEEPRPEFQTLEQRIAELEAAVGGQPDEWEPDGSEAENAHPASATILSYAQSAAHRSAFGQVDDLAQVDKEDYFDDEDLDMDDDEDDGFLETQGGEDAVLDEEALREMVAQIVREELQGELGERITRNVRRLVRREVQRAMTLKEFE